MGDTASPWKKIQTATPTNVLNRLKYIYLVTVVENILMMGSSDNFVSAHRFDSDIHKSEFMAGVRAHLWDESIVHDDFPSYSNTFHKHMDIHEKYKEKMPYMFNTEHTDLYDLITVGEKQAIWNYTISHYDDLYEYFDNYQSRFIDCCPVELKCEVLGSITDEYYVLDELSTFFDYENSDLIRKIIFYLLIKFI
jgi:hypothetical protein